jgi:hypothetical protein
MDSNTIGQAHNAAATMRALPWRVMSSNSWQALPLTAISGAQIPALARIRAIVTPGVGSYVASTPAATTDRVALCVMGADHKFSTRLGPSASPPV